MMRRPKWYVGQDHGKGALNRSSDSLIAAAAAPFQPLTVPPTLRYAHDPLTGTLRSHKVVVQSFIVMA
jgi:hypothetical protein